MSLTKVINTGIKNSEITGSKINTASSFSFDVLQANTITVANEFYSNSVNSAYNQANTANVLAQAAFDYANTISGGSAIDNVARTTANSAGTYANSGYAQANTANTLAQAAYDAANNAVDTWVRDAANSASSYANSAYNQANSNYTSAVTQLVITTPVFNYNIDQYSGDNPTIYVGAGETIAFDLNQSSSHPIAIRISNGGSNYNTGLTHVADDGTVSTGSNAQGKVSGKLYWKIPFELAGLTYVYQCTNHASMVGNIVIQSPVSFVASNTQLAFNTANSAGVYANAAYDAANNATDSWVRDASNSASSYANSGYALANTANTLAQAAYDQANTSAGGGGGSGLFNSAINTSVGYAVTSSLANAVVFSANAIVHSIYFTNISSDSTSNVQVLGDFTPSGTSNVSIFYKIPLPYRSSVEMLKKPQVVKTNDILKLQSFEDDVEASSNAHAIIVYETTDSADYERVGKLVTDAYSNMYTSTSAPSVVESIKLVNQDSSYGNHAITVVLTNSSNTLQGYLTKELILPANSTVELCETPKYMSAGDKFDAWATTTGVISIFVSAKKIT